MANRIKGITIDIGGDTTKLTASLKQVDSTLKNTQSQLKDVNTLLKFNPENTTLLAQKQTLLANAVKETKARSEELHKALDQMDENGVDKTSEQYQALQREIIETDSKLENLRKTQAEFGTVASQQLKIAGEKMQEFGSKVSSAGDSLTKGLTVPIAALGTACVAAFNEVDAGADTIVEKTGATGDALDEMQKQMEDIATTIPTSFEDAGDAIGEVNTRFHLTGDALEDLSTQFIKFAKINNTDVSTSVDNVQKVIAAFGLKAEDASSLLDTMNKVGQDTGISMDTLASTMSSNAAALQEMGLSAYDSAEFLGQVEVSGADTSAVMAGLKKALSNAAAEGKPLDEALSDLQDTISSSTDETTALNEASDLFGTKAAAQIVNACKNGTINFKDLSKSAGDAAGSVSDTFESTLDPIDEWTVTLNKLKVTGAKLGNSLSKTLVPMLEKVGDVAEKVADWFDSLSDEEKDQVVNLALIAAAAGPVLKIAGTAISTIGSITTGIGSLTGKMSTFNTTLGEGKSLSQSLTAVGINPLTLAITGCVAGYAALAIAAKSSHDAWLQNIEDQYGLTDSAKELMASTDDLTSSWNDLKKAQEESVAGVDSQYQHYQDLADEYDTLLDANGNVKAGEEDRANFIKTTLADALGIEEDDINKIIDANGNLGDSIGDLMDKQKAQAVLSTYTDEYTEAVKNQQQAVKDLAQYTSEMNTQDQKTQDAKTQMINATKTYNQALQSSSGATQEQYDAMMSATTAYSTASGELEQLRAKQTEANDALVGYNSTIANYEGVSAAIISGDTASINESLSQLTNGFITAETGDRQSLEAQTKDLQDQLQAMKDAVESGAPGITEAQIAEMQNMVDKSQAELDKMPVIATNEGESYKENITNELNQAAQNGEDAAARQQKAADSTDLGQSGTDQGKEYKDNLKEQEDQAVTDNQTHMNDISADAKNTSLQVGTSVKLPHFSWRGKFSLDPLETPHFSVSWYKKAMQNPYLLSGATIFGSAGGKLLGGGEAGNEVIMSESKYHQMQAGTTNNITIVQREGEDSTALAYRVAQITQKQVNDKEAVWR